MEFQHQIIKAKSQEDIHREEDTIPDSRDTTLSDIVVS
jgi:hypothetical protein